MDTVPGIRRIVDRLRARGHAVVYQPGWTTRGSSAFPALTHVVNHFDAFPASSGAHGGLRICTFGRPDLRNSLCMFYLGDDGLIFVVAARVSWHAGSGRLTANSRAVGIEARNNNLGEPMPAAMSAAYRALDEEIMAEWSMPLAHVIEHREHAPTRKSDRRGVDADAWRASLNRSPDPIGDPSEDPMLIFTLPDDDSLGSRAGRTYGVTAGVVFMFTNLVDIASAAEAQGVGVWHVDSAAQGRQLVQRFIDPGHPIGGVGGSGAAVPVGPMTLTGRIEPAG